MTHGTTPLQLRESRVGPWCLPWSTLSRENAHSVRRKSILQTDFRSDIRDVEAASVAQTEAEESVVST